MQLVPARCMPAPRGRQPDPTSLGAAGAGKRATGERGAAAAQRVRAAGGRVCADAQRVGDAAGAAPGPAPAGRAVVDRAASLLPVAGVPILRAACGMFVPQLMFSSTLQRCLVSEVAASGVTLCPEPVHCKAARKDQVRGRHPARLNDTRVPVLPLCAAWWQARCWQASVPGVCHRQPRCADDVDQE